MNLVKNNIEVKRLDVNILADSTRVLARFLILTRKDRVEGVVAKVIDIPEESVRSLLEEIYKEFEHRHYNFRNILDSNYNYLSNFYTLPVKLSDDKKLLIGAYYTHEYSIEGAALFNPSIVLHPDQSILNENEIRFILSLRATGEGHISSIEFRTGIFNGNEIIMDSHEKKITSGEIKINQKSSNYELKFDSTIPISSRILFPVSDDESNGMEDARFVRFTENGKTMYYGTYTAYNGHEIKVKMIETEDFCHYKISELKVSAVSDKGMALFPEKINGKYVMIGRQSAKDISIMYSDNLYSWDNFEYIQYPERPWELTQIGNNGSPLKTKHGWLLLTHAVGPMRKYTMSATLLDLNNPSKVIGSLEQPLLSPNEFEREGYVPNVIYTCGALLQDDKLIIPYAMSDSAIKFATVKIEEIINKILK